MKKIIILSVTFLFVKMTLNAQIKSLPSDLVNVIDLVKKGDLKNYELATDDTTASDYFNVLLSTRTNQYLYAVDNGVAGKIDGTSNNSCLKLNDSTYEIDIQNLAKQTILIFSESEKNLWFNESENENIKPLFQPLALHVYTDSLTHKKYMAMSYNPILEDWQLLDSNKKCIRKFILKYIFPKPVISFNSTNDNLIKEKIQSPSHIYYGNEINKNNNIGNTSVFPAKKSLLFVFNHFLGNARSESGGEGNDIIQYKLDSATDWSSTSLSYTPSILLENLSLGKHVLYAKYPSNYADILEYHFSIAPN